MSDGSNVCSADELFGKPEVDEQEELTEYTQIALLEAYNRGKADAYKEMLEIRDNARATGGPKRFTETD